MNYAAELAKFSRLAEEKGFVNSLEGNVSVIDRSTGYIYITPSHKAKCLLTPEQVCVVAPDGTQIGGTEKKSSEFFLHQAAYAARPDLNAIVHSHCPYLGAYAMAERDFEGVEHTSLYELFAKIKCLPYGQRGTHAIHQGIEEALNGCTVALLGGHGTVCMGEDLENALGIIEAAENYAKTIAIMKAIK